MGKPLRHGTGFHCAEGEVAGEQLQERVQWGVDAEGPFPYAEAACRWRFLVAADG